ncbi:MAG TPA: chromosome segregation protein SMC, partial [Alphaproteobacteria bacterium]
QKQSLDQQNAQDSRRRDAVRDRLASVQQQLAGKKAALEGDDVAVTLREEIETLESEATSLQAQIAVLETGLENARAAQQVSRQSLQDAQSRASKIESEIETLESVVKVFAEEGFRPVFEDIRTDEGFELALSRALGDTLMASADSDAPVMWQKRDIDVPSLPAGCAPLTPHIKAPDVMKLALSQIGFVESESEGHSLSTQLKPGQSIVSRDGAYWRWDGLTVRVSASDRHAAQLKHKNRLVELAAQLPEAEEILAEAQETAKAADSDFTETRAVLAAKQRELQDCDQTLRRKRGELTRAVEQQAGRQAELAKLEESISLAETDLVALDERIAETATALAGFDETKFAEQQAKIEHIRAELSEAREQLQEAISNFEVSRQEQGRRKARLHAIADERVNLQNRCIRARERVRELDERDTQLKTRIEELKKRPIEIKADSEALLTKIGEKESEKAVVSDRLAAVEAELADTNKALKEAEALLSEAREARAHAQATVSERQGHMEEVRNYIQEQFGMGPEHLAAEAALNPEAMPDLESLKQQKEKDVRSRDLIGPVNLRADIEAEDLEKELTGILNEKNDLAQAVEELRQGIEKLNVEARERLNTAFERVNAHFRDMFTRLFSGGKAHLALIESADPLEAGLEIFAQPPGKALQSLSLLSGGEQTLTAVALIFAIFMTNPSPICVLDEVDAPLDDANVDRFCDLLEEFADRGETRFLLITHHRLTMARMDRLYGVTMSEKGVSQLVSVDMNQQMDFLEAAE